MCLNVEQWTDEEPSDQPTVGSDTKNACKTAAFNSMSAFWIEIFGPVHAKGLEILILWEETKISVSYSATSQVQGERWSPEVRDWEYDNVLSGWGYHTPRRVVADEGMKISRGKQKKLRQSLSMVK
jgi:hypothetical protein